MDPEERKWLESNLKKYGQAKGYSNVQLTESSIMGEGTNFTSEIQWVQVIVEDGKGNKRDKIILMKKLLPQLLNTTMMKEWELFETEIKMYSKILPQMEEVLRGKEPLWGKYLGHRDSDRLLLEDLREDGFRMAKRTEGLDLDHCLLVIRSMARFHSLSPSLVRKGYSKDIQGIPDFVFNGRLEMSNEYLRTCLSAVCNVTAPLWPHEMDFFKKAITKVASIEIKELVSVFDKDKAKLKVMNHGDCWVNNMLFRYDEETNKPVSIRFVDFQMSHYNSYAMDLQYFLGTSLNEEVRLNHYESLIVEYQKAFSNELKSQGDEDLAPSLDEVLKEMERCEIVGMMASTTIFPIVLSTGEMMPSKKEEDWEKRLEKTSQKFANPLYVKSFLQILQKSKQAGRLGKLLEKAS